jgi:ATP-binding cassette subfamily C protein CydC
VLSATAGRATLLITHELDGLDQVDEIVVLDRGRVAERGTHAELIASAGLYRQLWQAAQARLSSGVCRGGRHHYTRAS